VNASAQAMYRRAFWPNQHHGPGDECDHACERMQPADRIEIEVHPAPPAYGLLTDSNYIAGKRTTKRAPSTVGPSSCETPMRFSARMRPPCASTIWREIESPSPEF